MTWKDTLDKAVKAIKDVADNEKVKGFAATAQTTAINLAKKAKEGALSAAEALVHANADPTAIRIRYLNAEFNIMSPSDGIEITRPNGGTIVVNDGAGNGLVINASADKAQVAKTLGTVNRLSDNTYDLGSKDGVNVVVFKH